MAVGFEAWPPSWASREKQIHWHSASTSGSQAAVPCSDFAPAAFRCRKSEPRPAYGTG
jgi:hypothetical protein